jgi:hypothetical protein
VSRVALNLSALLQKDSVALARFVIRFTEFTIAMRDTLEIEISALIQRKSAKTFPVAGRCRLITRAALR